VAERRSIVRSLVAASALTAAVGCWLFLRPAEGGASSLLFVLPVMVAASRLGAAGGAAWGLLCFFVYTTWATLQGSRDLDEDLGRLVAFTVVGLLVGHYSYSRSATSWHARQLFDMSTDLVVTVDDRGRIQSFNAAWQREFGYEPQELLGEPVFRFVHPDDVDAALDAFDVVQQEGRLEGLTQVRCLTADGEVRWIEWLGVAAPDDGLVHGVGRDITERQRTQEHVRELLRRLQQTRDDERHRMAGELHDFALQQQIVALMKIERVAELPTVREDEDSRRVLGEAADSIRSGIQEARRIMQGHEPTLSGHAELSTALDAAANDAERSYGVRVERSISLTHEVDSRLRLTVYRLVVEALRNAGKHADATTVSLEVHTDGECVEAVITDDGVGFDEPLHLRNEASPAMGFGMTIVLEQVLAAHGTYEVRSQPHRGTRVRITVPREQFHAQVPDGGS
jgi:PAS domain S-box-containing protein